MQVMFTNRLNRFFLIACTASFLCAAPASAAPIDQLVAEVERLKDENLRQQEQIDTLLAELRQLRGALAAAPQPAPPPPIEAPEKPQILRQPPVSPSQKSFLGSKWEADIYGFIKLDAIYHNGRVNNEHIGTFALAGDDNPFSLTTKETRIGIAFKGKPADATLSGRLEVDFYGDTNPANSATFTPRARLAFVDWALPGGWSFRAGRDWDTYLAVYPKHLNFNALGGQGFPWARRDHLRASYSRPVGSGTLLFSASATTSAGSAGDDLPAFQGKIQYERPFNHGKLLLALSGAWDQDAIGGVGDNRLDADLLALSLSLPLASAIKLEGMLYTGQALGAAYHGGINQATFLNQATGRLEALRTVGGFAQISYQALPSLALNLGFGVDNPDHEADWANLTFNQTAFLNAYYELYSGLFLASELQHFLTEHSNVTAFSPDGRILSRQTNEHEAFRWQNSVIFRF